MYRFSPQVADDPLVPGRSPLCPAAGFRTVAGAIEAGPQPRAPRLETVRLVLRGYCVADRNDHAELMGAPESFLYSNRPPLDDSEAWTRLLRHVGHWALTGWGMFAVVDKESGRTVGQAGFEDFHRGLGSRFDRVPEASWTIARWAWGRGYATEAAAAILAWMEERFGAERTVCLIHAGNIASLRVAEKIGYRIFAVQNYRDYPAFLFERRREAPQLRLA